MNTVITGRCLCESVAYEVKGELGNIYHCHCSRCRRWHGSAFRTRASVPKSQFRWVKGKEHVQAYEPPEGSTKHFCRICGSALISTYRHKPDVIGLPLGGIEQDPGKRPLGHIFVKDKASWYEITDKLPQYDAWPESGADQVRG